MTSLEKLEMLLSQGILRSCFSTMPIKAYGVEVWLDTPNGRIHWKTPPCPTLADAIEYAWEWIEKTKQL